MSIGRFEPMLRSTKVRKPSMPLKRLVLEARVLAEFVEAHWEPRRSGRVRLPGLRAATAAGLERHIADDLRDLASAVQSADGELLVSKLTPTPVPVVEAHRLLRELRAPLRFLLDGRTARGRVFEKLDGPKTARSAHALALSLEAHAMLAERHAADLARLGDFNPDLPERARRLAMALREPRRDAERNIERQRTLHARDALVTLLMERMRTVRAAARFVFRDHPQLAKKATSEYERKRKQKNERKHQTDRKRRTESRQGRA